MYSTLSSQFSLPKLTFQLKIHRNTRILKTLTQPTSGRRDRPVIAQGAKRVPQEFDAEGMFCASSVDVVSTIVRFTSISWPITKGSNPSAISITPIAVSTVSNKPHRKSPGTQFRSIHSVTCFPIAYVPVKLKFSKKICLHLFAGCYCLRDLVLSLLSKGWYSLFHCPSIPMLMLPFDQAKYICARSHVHLFSYTIAAA